MAIPGRPAAPPGARAPGGRATTSQLATQGRRPAGSNIVRSRFLGSGNVACFNTGLIGITAGVLVLKHPLLAAVTVPTMLVILLGVQGLIMGMIQIISAFKGGGLGSFVLGAINIAVGLLLLGSPIAATLAVPFVFGVLLLVQGVALTIWAFRVRA